MDVVAHIWRHSLYTRRMFDWIFLFFPCVVLLKICLIQSTYFGCRSACHYFHCSAIVKGHKWFQSQSICFAGFGEHTLRFSSIFCRRGLTSNLYVVEKTNVLGPVTYHMADEESMNECKIHWVKWSGFKSGRCCRATNTKKSNHSKCFTYFIIAVECARKWKNSLDLQLFQQILDLWS